MTDDDRNVDWIEAVSALPRGAAVIVRSRDPNRRQELAHALRQHAAPLGIRLMIAGDPKLAIRVRAAGLHMPDRPAVAVAQFRKTVPNALVTAAAHGSAGLMRAARIGVDAAFLSAAFATQSHPSASAMGPIRWALAVKGSNLRIAALGGVTAANANRLVAAGAKGLAVIGSWTAR